MVIVVGSNFEHDETKKRAFLGYKLLENFQNILEKLK
jgi:hypothetical protein